VLAALVSAFELFLHIATGVRPVEMMEEVLTVAQQ
jgi:hypothetical protein